MHVNIVTVCFSREGQLSSVCFFEHGSVCLYMEVQRWAIEAGISWLTSFLSSLSVCCMWVKLPPLLRHPLSHYIIPFHTIILLPPILRHSSSFFVSLYITCLNKSMLSVSVITWAAFPSDVWSFLSFIARSFRSVTIYICHLHFLIRKENLPRVVEGRKPFIWK